MTVFRGLQVRFQITSTRDKMSIFSLQMKFVFVLFCLESIALSVREVRGHNSSVAPDSASGSVAPSLLVSSVGDEETNDGKDQSVRDSTTEVPAWRPQDSLLLSLIRNLLLEAKESSEVTTQPSTAQQVDADKNIFKTLDRIFGRPQRTTTAREATSSSVSSESVGSESTIVADSSPVGTKSQLWNTESDVGSETIGEVLQAPPNVSEGSAAEDGPCRRCYSDLHSCVQKCFLKHNCHQLERNARQCPPAPSRMCSPFAAWRPREECNEHHECSSPLLCCNDGCVNRCGPGIAKS